MARTHVASLFGARPLAALGRRSYGLYLWHWPIFALTRPDQDVAFGGPRLLLLRLALTFAMAELCYRYLEMPVRRGELAAGLARLRARPWLLGLGAALTAAATIGVVCLSSARLAAARLDSARPPMPQADSGESSSNAGAVARAQAPRIAEFVSRAAGVALRPEWPKTLTLLSDSVTLAVAKSLPAALPGWKVEVLGRPALMVKQVVPEFLNARSVGSVVVIGLGYNSLFEKDRKNFERWSGVWDRGAERLLADLKACGAKKLVWITLREPSPELVTEAGRDQYREYAWFFPYVNERIHALAARHSGAGRRRLAGHLERAGHHQGPDPFEPRRRRVDDRPHHPSGLGTARRALKRP